MHEFSIVRSLLDLCEKNAAEHDARAVTKVSVKIGVLSGVEPELLKTAFETFKEGTICHGALFDMLVQPVTVACKKCDWEGSLPENLFHCPACESEEITVTDGEEMYLMSLEME